MAATVRFLTRRANGQESVRLAQIEAESFTIGRGSDCQLELSDRRVGLLHAHVTELSPGVVAVEAEGSQSLISGGRRTRRAELNLSEPRTIEIAPFRLTFRREESQTVIDVVREETALKAPSVEEAEAVFRLRGAGLSKRGAAWALVALVAVACLAFPLWIFGRPAAETIGAQAFGRAHGAPGLLHASVSTTATELGAGQMWSPGPLSEAHAFLSADCKSCHTTALRSVADATCLRCHKGLQDHADAHLMSRAMAPASLFEAGNRAIAARFDKPVGRCADCHMEHQGERGFMNTRQSQCVDCHAHLATRLGGRSTVGDVSDFATGHPAFRPTVVVAPRDGAPVLTRRWTTDELDRARILRDGPVIPHGADCEGFASGKANFRSVADIATPSADKARPGDNNGLVFSHAVHLSASGCVAGLARQLGIQRAKSGALGCANCHTASRDGGGFAPVEMKRDCSACHSLTFDTANGLSRTLPHGEPRLVVASMLDFYKASAVDAAAGASDPDRRLPGQAAADQRAQMRAATLDHADSRAVERVRAIFSPGGACYGCHEIIRPASGLGFGVAPVVLQQHFLPKAEFDHRVHMTAGMTCEQCHAARSSQSASDVLMPSIQTCRACHRSEHAFAEVRSPCITCHLFHPGGSHSQTLASTLADGDGADRGVVTALTPLPMAQTGGRR